MKENVVVGRLIPAGTGLSYHSDRKKAREAGDVDEFVTKSTDEIEAELQEALSQEAGGDASAQDAETEALTQELANELSQELSAQAPATDEGPEAEGNA